MLIAMTTNDTVDYVSDLDPAKVRTYVPRDEADASKGKIEKIDLKPGATVFKLRSLDVFMKGMIYDNSSVLKGSENSNDYGIHTKTNATNIDAVRHGLIGFENFTDAKGEPLAFDTQRVVFNGRVYEGASDKVLNLLGIRLIQELAVQIKKMSEVTAAEEKNSDAASAPAA